MGDFYSELKRRNVVRVGIAYAVAGGLIIEVMDTVAPRLGLPDWVPTFVIIAVLIGLPIALFFSWSYELTPQGLKKTHEVDADASITHSTGRRLDFAIIGMLVLALGYFVWDKFGAEPTLESDGLQSIAVLPFVNMSNDPEQEFFSDGISEELLNLLAKIPELRVISRTSAFSFKGKNMDIPAIAEQLNVAHVLEGSVRRSGNQVRITAQLIDVKTDSHLWSETYERTLDDIFATQDEIAARVVKQLKITLLGEAPTVQATDPEAYALVLQARYVERQNTPAAYEKSIALLEQALAIDPDYAAAWAGLALGYTSQAGQGLRPIDEGYRLAREAASHALALDPAHGPAYLTLARIVMFYDRDLVAAARLYEQALAVEPANIGSISSAARMLANLGRMDQAIALAEYAAARDPVNPVGNFNRGLLYLRAGRLDEAIAAFRSTLTLSPGFISAQYFIGRVLMQKGEPQAALEAMQREDSHWRMYGLPMGYRALGRADASDAALAEVIEQHAQHAAYNLAYILAYRGEADRAFAWLNKAVASNDPSLAEIATEPLFANLHDDPRWLLFLDSIGKSREQLATIEFKVTLPE